MKPRIDTDRFFDLLAETQNQVADQLYTELIAAGSPPSARDFDVIQTSNLVRDALDALKAKLPHRHLKFKPPTFEEWIGRASIESIRAQFMKKICDDETSLVERARLSLALRRFTTLAQRIYRQSLTIP